MKKIEAVIQPFKLDEIREALAKEKLPRISIFEIKEAGSQQGKVKQYRGARYIEDSADVKIEIVVDDDDAEPLAAMIATILRSGDLCDGEVIITPVERVLRVRVGQRDYSGSTWQHDVAPSDLMRNRTTLKTYLKTPRRKFHEAD